jgi:hypothetical protein
MAGMQQYDFINILIKYRAGKASAEEQCLVDGWYSFMARFEINAVEEDKVEKIGRRYWNNIEKIIKSTRRKGSLNAPLPGSKLKYDGPQTEEQWYTQFVSFLFKKK